MLQKSRDGRDGIAKRAKFKRFLPLLLVMILLIQCQKTYAAVQSTSGSVQLGNTLQYGATAYSVEFSYPSTAEVGTNLTIALTLHVDSLTGLVEYIYNYQLIAKVFVGANALDGNASMANNGTFLYPGSSWGPNNVTIPLTAENTGLAKGASANATVSVTLMDGVYYGGGLVVFNSEPAMEGAAGSLAIRNPADGGSATTSQIANQTQNNLPYALFASAAVLMLAVVVLQRWPRQSQQVK
jgi:hypothetical protein